MFPYIVTEPPFQHMIREELLVEAKHMFPDAINSIDDIIDVAVLDKNGWMMYGSHKPECKPYILQDILTYESEDDIGVTLPIRVETSSYYTPSVELVNLFSIRRFTMAEQISIRPEMIDVVEAWEEDFLADHSGNDSITARKFNADIRGYTPDLNTIKDLVAILDASRASQRTTWIELGWCLHNISESLLECWIEFSERDPAYEATARGVYSRME